MLRKAFNQKMKAIKNVDDLSMIMAAREYEAYKHEIDAEYQLGYKEQLIPEPPIIEEGGMRKEIQLSFFRDSKTIDELNEMDSDDKSESETEESQDEETLRKVDKSSSD